jgi:hypothetical protein
MIYDKTNLEVRLIKFIDDEAQKKIISKKILRKRRRNVSPSDSNKSLHNNEESYSPVTNHRN